MGKGSLFNKCCWENWRATCKKNEIRKFSHTIHKNKLKIKDLEERPETIKLLEENTGSTLFDIGLSNILKICLLRQGKQKQKFKNET